MNKNLVKSIPATSPQDGAVALLPNLIQGVILKLACKCSPRDDADYLIKNDKLVCAGCGSRILCHPPILGVFKATCNCCISSETKSTFILDSKGNYVCTWCGLSR